MIMALRDEFLSTLEAGALEAAEELGINLTTQDAQSDTSKLLQFRRDCKKCRTEGNHC
jgi:inositol transport system substrate-binding protein